MEAGPSVAAAESGTRTPGGSEGASSPGRSAAGSAPEAARPTVAMASMETKVWPERERLSSSETREHSRQRGWRPRWRRSARARRARKSGRTARRVGRCGPVIMGRLGRESRRSHGNGRLWPSMGPEAGSVRFGIATLQGAFLSVGRDAWEIGLFRLAV